MRTTLLLLLLLLANPCGATSPGIDVEVTVTRYTEFALDETQTRILDEATRVSTAARVFHGLYDHWPSDVPELAGRTSGIDFSVFEGKILVDTVPEGLVVTVFDGHDVRRLLATADWPVSPEDRVHAADPDFRIRISLHRESREPGVLPSGHAAALAQASDEDPQALYASLIAWSVSDFAARGPKPAEFRDVQVRYADGDNGERRYLLCGEFLPAGNRAAAWTAFATIRTDPYEQWVGAQAADLCGRATFLMAEGEDLSAALLAKWNEAARPGP